MKQHIAQAWIEDLRHGGHKQGMEALCTRLSENDYAFCCLGRLCEVAIKSGEVELSKDYNENKHGYLSYDRNTSTLPASVRKWAGMSTTLGTVVVGGKITSLAHMNDKGQTFLQIADFIEQCWESL